MDDTGNIDVDHAMSAPSPADRVFKTAELRNLILDHLPASDVAALHLATRLPMTREDAIKYMDPLRDLGFVHDAIIELERAGVKVLVVGMGIYVLQNRIRNPLDTRPTNPIFVGLVFSNFGAAHEPALSRFFSRMHCSLSTSGDLGSLLTSGDLAYTVNDGSGDCWPRRSFLQRATPQVSVVLPSFFTPTYSEFALPSSSGAISSMVGLSGEPGTGQAYLPVARASSMWRFAVSRSVLEGLDAGFKWLSFGDGFDFMMLINTANDLACNNDMNCDYAFGLARCLRQLV